MTFIFTLTLPSPLKGEGKKEIIDCHTLFGHSMTVNKAI